MPWQRLLDNDNNNDGNPYRIIRMTKIVDILLIINYWLLITSTGIINDDAVTMLQLWPQWQWWCHDNDDALTTM